MPPDPPRGSRLRRSYLKAPLNKYSCQYEHPSENLSYAPDSDRPLKRDGKERGYVLNISPSKSDKKGERLKRECFIKKKTDCQPKVV